MQPSPSPKPDVKVSLHPALQRRRKYFDATTPFPYGATVASRDKPLSMPPVATGAVSSFLRPLLAALHHVQSITRWPSATTLPPSPFPHAGIFASCCQARWWRSSLVPEHTTYRDPRSCPLEAGCIRNNVPACRACQDHAPSHCGSGVSATFTCSASRPVIAGSLRQHRNQVWSVNPCLAKSRRTVVPGLPTLTSATPERRPGRPYTVVHV